jgi:hypothetical protein
MIIVSLLLFVAAALIAHDAWQAWRRQSPPVPAAPVPAPAAND